jgi:circadian clock protein KaiC
VHHFYQSAVDLYVDEWLTRLLEQVEGLGIRRVLIDSLGDLEIASADRMRFREFVYSLIQRCTRAGVSVMFTMELPELFRAQRLSEDSFSHLTDNVVLLQYVQRGATLRRALTVVKSRGTPHDPQTHEFDITSDGVVLGEPIDPSDAGSGS